MCDVGLQGLERVQDVDAPSFFGSKVSMIIHIGKFCYLLYHPNPYYHLIISTFGTPSSLRLLSYLPICVVHTH